MKGCLEILCRMALVLAVLIAVMPVLAAVSLLFVIEELEEKP